MQKVVRATRLREVRANCGFTRFFRQHLVITGGWLSCHCPLLTGYRRLRTEEKGYSSSLTSQEFANGSRDRAC